MVGGLRLLGVGWQEEREEQNYDPIEQNPSPGDHIQEKVDEPPARACRGSLCAREDKPGQQASGTSSARSKLPQACVTAALSRPAGWTRGPWGEQILTAEAAALDPGLPLELSMAHKSSCSLPDGALGHSHPIRAAPNLERHSHPCPIREPEFQHPTDPSSEAP